MWSLVCNKRNVTDTARQNLADRSMERLESKYFVYGFILIPIHPDSPLTVSSAGQRHYPTVPDAATLVSNIDMVLVHSNFLASQPVMLPPNVQMIGCTQCRDARPLPKVR